MRREDYRRAFDTAGFRGDFQQRTIEKLTQEAARRQEKEIIEMKPKRTIRKMTMAAAIAAVMVVSAAAAALILTPWDVANRLEDTALAAAFETEGAVLMNQTVESEDYRFALAGLISGKGLSEFTQDLEESRTYIVASVARIDGAPIDALEQSFTFTPLVEGYAPWMVNAWTLCGGYSNFTVDGVVYYLFDCKSVEIFADHTVYLAAYEGSNFPNQDMFAMADDGSISFAEGVEGARWFFTLPLDESKADPIAAEQFLNDTGLILNG